MDRIRKRMAAAPLRLRLLVGLIALIAVAAWLFFAHTDRKAPLSTRPAGVSGEANGRFQAPDAGSPEDEPVFLQSVRLQPDQPTRMDSVRAEVVPAPTTPEGLAYLYRWKVNDQVVGDAKEDTLILSPFKKGDLVSVVVTPHDNDLYGHAVESPVIAVHAVPPSLEMKPAKLLRKTGAPVELQLLAAAPDGERLTFSLEPPVTKGMTIDSVSGKITWILQPKQQGIVRFAAAVEDDNGTKVTKTFEIMLD